MACGRTIREQEIIEVIRSVADLSEVSELKTMLAHRRISLGGEKVIEISELAQLTRFEAALDERENVLKHS
jgi:hypothetical protein